MLDYPALRALAEVIRTGSFEAAARALHVTPSAISQRIRQLEERMGEPLVRRATPCTATPAGARLARHYEQVRLLEQDLGMAREDEEARVRVRLAINADSLDSWLIPALAHGGPFLFDLLIDDQDHAHDWLAAGEVVAAVSSDAGPHKGCDTVALGRLRYLATATPAFVGRHFRGGVTAEALARAPSLRFNHKDKLQDQWAERHLAARGEAMIALPAHLMASSRAFHIAAREGLGWGMNIEPMVAGDLAAGRLVRLDAAPLDVPLYWHSLRAMRAPLAQLTSAVKRAASARLLPPE